MTATTDRQIALAGLTRIFQLAQQGAIEIPLTQLSAPVVADSGVWSVSVDSTSGFRPGQMLSFWDGLGCPYGWGTSGANDYLPSGEESLAVTAASGGAITLDSSGIGYDGLQYAHQSGAYVAANIADEVMGGMQDSLNTGYPLILCRVGSQSDTHDLGGRQRQTASVHRWAPMYELLVEYRLNAVVQPEGSMSPQVYGRRQRERARSDVEAIAKCLRDNRQLPVNGFNNAIEVQSTARLWTNILRSEQSDETIGYLVILSVPVTGISYVS